MSLAQDRRLHHLGSALPQGSVLGSLFLTLYSNDVEDIIEAHALLPYNYADDCKVFFYCRA